ncbi:PAS domain-containing sensor histidine kinase [Dyella marensis]|uniref:sensor histidine kinase n=1 Tax=Dyella marensis TaxID=500610 RepID=UPI0031D6DADC
MHSILARTPRSSLRGLLSAVVACALATAAAGLLLRVFDLSNVVALFLFTVVLVALHWGKLAGAAAALVGVLSFDFFFVPPVYSFHVSDAQYLFTFALTVAVAFVTGRSAELAREARLRVEGERLRHALLAAVSHDLKTPLTAIRGLAETLESADRRQAEVARSIRQQADALHRQVGNLLDMARMQEQGVRLQLEWQAIGEVVECALAVVVGLGERKIRVDMQPALPLVEIDACLFERVLINLLDNAAKYTPHDATIEIGACVVGKELCLHVKDDGPGLPRDMAPEALFQPFTRGVRESSIGGSGLGLALCRRIVEAHGGAMHAVPGLLAGARFEIRLPLRRPPSIERERD